MKILFVIPYFVPAWGFGGPVRLAFDYAKELVKRGHRVTVYASDVLDSKSRVDKKNDNLDGITVNYLSNLSNFLAWRKIFLPLGFPKLLGKSIKNFDLIHCFDFRTFQNIWVNQHGVKNKVPYVVSVLGQTRKGTGVRDPIKTVYDFFWGRRILNEAQLVFAQNNHEKEDLKKFGVKDKKISLLPLAIDFSEFKNIPKRGALRRKYNINKNDFVILFIGRIHYLKGIDFLIKALPEIRKEIQKVKLVIVGRDDGYLEQLKNLTKEKNLKEAVIFTGPVYGKERINAYRDADVFIITPRLFEETSLASLEAVAVGTPIIVSQKCQVPFLEKFQAGITLLDEKPRSITQAILQVVGQKKKMGKMAREMVKERFKLEKIVGQLENYYLQVMS